MYARRPTRALARTYRLPTRGRTRIAPRRNSYLSVLRNRAPRRTRTYRRR